MRCANSPLGFILGQPPPSVALPISVRSIKPLGCRDATKVSTDYGRYACCFTDKVLIFITGR